MRIGIDFDNTIVSYDALFHKVARERDLVPSDTPVNKVAVRDHLRRIGQEEHWTEMQGYVYGARMDEALAYEGVIDFIRCAGDKGHTLAIISHKSKHPFLGPQHDLHAAARSWVERYLFIDNAPLIPSGQVFFELTKETKLNRIGAFGCDVFIDDLPEIFLSEGFPKGVRPILFDPELHHGNLNIPNAAVCKSWAEIKGELYA